MATSRYIVSIAPNINTVAGGWWVSVTCRATGRQLRQTARVDTYRGARSEAARLILLDRASWVPDVHYAGA